MAIRDEFNTVTRNGEEMILLEDNSNNIKWEKTVEKTITGNGKIEFTGNRNKPIKEMLFEGFCVQEGTPSPDNPKPIKVNDSVWKASGKNLWIRGNDTVYQGVSITNKNDGGIELNGTATITGNYYVSIGINAAYYSLQCARTGTFPDTAGALVQLYAGSEFIGLTNRDTSTKIVSAQFSAKNSVDLRIRVENGFTYDHCVIYPMLVEGEYTSETMPAFEPSYSGGSVDLSSIKLGGIGTVKNTYDAQTGSHVKKIFKKIFNGDEIMTTIQPYIKSDACDVNIQFFGISGNNVRLCSHLTVDTQHKIWSEVGFPNTFRAFGDNFHINIANEVLGITDYTQETVQTAIAKVRAFIKDQYDNGTPLEFCYEDTQITEQLTPQPITQRKGANTITQVSGSVENTVATAKVYGFPYESVSLKFAQHAVDRHIAKDLIPIGAELSDTWRTYDAPWRVVHHYPTGNAMALEWEYVTPNKLKFDAPEAICYVTEPLEPGTYHIGIGSNNGAWNKNESIQFTFVNTIPSGAQIYIDCVSSSLSINPTNGRLVTVYSSKGSRDIIETTTTSNGTDGISLGSTSTSGAQNTNGNINAIARACLGYNAWSQSAIRQYLNATESKGNWWHPMNNWDRPIDEAETIDGFLYDCSEQFISIIKPAKVITALYYDENLYEITEDKIFIPAFNEKYIYSNITRSEGEQFEYYKILAQKEGLVGMFQRGTSYEVLKKNRVDSTTTYSSSFFRSPSSSTVISVGYNGDSGGSNYDYISNAKNHCPCCILHDGTYQPVEVTEEKN